MSSCRARRAVILYVRCISRQIKRRIVIGVVCRPLNFETLSSGLFVFLNVNVLRNKPVVVRLFSLPSVNNVIIIRPSVCLPAYRDKNDESKCDFAAANYKIFQHKTIRSVAREIR